MTEVAWGTTRLLINSVGEGAMWVCDTLPVRGHTFYVLPRWVSQLAFVAGLVDSVYNAVCIPNRHLCNLHRIFDPS